MLGSWSWAALSSGAWDVHDRGAGWCGDNPRKPLMGKNEVMPQSSVARPRQGICATVGGTRETEAFIFYTFDVPTRLICGRHPHDRPVSRPEHPLDDEDVSNTSTECMQEFTHLLGKLNFLLGIPTLSFAQKRWLGARGKVSRQPSARQRRRTRWMRTNASRAPIASSTTLAALSVRRPSPCDAPRAPACVAGSADVHTTQRLAPWAAPCSTPLRERAMRREESVLRGLLRP